MNTNKDSADIFASCCSLLIMALVSYWVFTMANRVVGAIEEIRDAVVQMAKERLENRGAAGPT